jgi:hypothetical protein
MKMDGANSAGQVVHGHLRAASLFTCGPSMAGLHPAAFS